MLLKSTTFLVLFFIFLNRAYVEKYLLEKSRLVYQEHNERWAHLRNADSYQKPSYEQQKYIWRAGLGWVAVTYI